jgi:3D (Asp-Asp-Asp) domain-containing protein
MCRNNSTPPHVTPIRPGCRHVTVLMSLVLLTACASRKPAVVTPPPPAPRVSAEPLTFTATAYCTGHVTASGTSVSAGVVAADPAVLPMGTVIRITGAAPYDGSYRVLDTGARVRNRHVDLYIADCAAAKRFGRRSVRVTIVEPSR